MTEALAPDEAFSRLSQAAGSRFDPKLVEALERVTKDGEQRRQSAAL
jgi:HD-GYP domain-containing protein (c-di-GMP phosphodiesterase class II)